MAPDEIEVRLGRIRHLTIQRYLRIQSTASFKNREKWYVCFYVYTLFRYFFSLHFSLCRYVWPICSVDGRCPMNKSATAPPNTV